MDKKEGERKGCAKDLQVANINRVVAKALPIRCYLVTVMKKMREMCNLLFISVLLSSLPTSLSLSFLIYDLRIRVTWQSYFRIK